MPRNPGISQGIAGLKGSESQSGGVPFSSMWRSGIGAPCRDQLSRLQDVGGEYVSWWKGMGEEQLQPLMVELDLDG